MKKFGFLSFGHYAIGHQRGITAADSLKQSLDIAQAADNLGVNGAYFRVHHFAPQAASPIPIMSAIAGSTKHIEVGTGVIDMRYENPYYLAEEAAALDLLSDGRVALGVSRGSPEPAKDGWRAFGYDAEQKNGSDMARRKFLQLLSAVRGEAVAEADTLERQYPQMYQPGTPLPIFPHSPGLDRRIWWGSGTNATAVQAAKDGVNLMSSTLVSEADGSSLGDIQAEQIRQYREAWDHDWTPRVSVSRTVFPIVDDETRRLFALHGESHDQIGSLGEGRQVTFGKTYADEPDRIVEKLKKDKAVMDADTLMLTIPNTMGVDVNVKILAAFAEHVAPALGWEPSNLPGA